VGKTEIEEIISKIARIPPASVSQDDRAALKNLDRDLKAVVFGQDQAIEALVSAIRTARSGLANPQKPIGPFFSRDQQGSERPRSRASSRTAWDRIAPLRHVRIHGAARGVAPYRRASRLRGLRPGGLLTEAVTKKPYAVLLLDEIEKRTRTSSTSCCR